MSQRMFNYGGSEVDKDAHSKLTQYKNSKAVFLRVLQKWIPERRVTLEKLAILLSEVSDDALKYNKAQASFRELSYNCRTAKREVESETLHFFTSLGALVGDVFSGISSAAEACKVDTFQTRFKEIIRQDAEITEELRNARSRYMAKYHGIEEVIRYTRPGTLSSTVDTIQKTLALDKHWTAIQEAENFPRLMNAVGNFLEKACQPESLGAMGRSVEEYFDNNPAAFDACKSTGKAIYGAIDTFGDKKESENSIVKREVKSVVNHFLLVDEKREIDRLNKVINEGTTQSKLQSTIEDVIEDMEMELQEMRDIYMKLITHDSYDSD